MAVIEFPKRGKTHTEAGMRKQINYIMREDKTNAELIGGKLCDCTNPQITAEEFLSVKEEYGKMNGIQSIHFMQSFSPEEKVTPKMLCEAAQRLMKFPQFDGFQMVYAVHIDREHLHTHFIINSVNAETGKKWHQTDGELQDLKDYSDDVCRELGLSVIDNNKKKGHEDTGEYRAKQNARSWKHEFYLASDYALKLSISREDFISKMDMLGYQVNWTDTHKNVLLENKLPVINSAGEEKIYRCRMSKLYPPEHFTKEAMEKTFEENARSYTAEELNYKTNKLLEFFQEAQKANPNCPLAEMERVINEAEKNSLHKFERTQKGELFQAVVQTLYRSMSREDFVSKMKQVGYKVNWKDNRKYVLFEKIPIRWQVPDGDEGYKEYIGREYKCRNNKLYPPERFTKEAMEARFEKNLQHKTQEQLDTSMSLFLKAVQLFRHSEPEYPMSSMAASGNDLSGAALKAFMYNYEEGSLYNKNLTGELLNDNER